jgi:Uma2 family endonuclease
MELHSLDKHEFCAGEIFAMAGASPEHNLIVGNLIQALKNALHGKCRVYPSDQRLQLPAGLYTYADVSLVWGASAFNDDTPRALRNPDAIFEVLSSSSESYDRGEKFAIYRTLPSHQDYVLVNQSKVLVEHFVRQPDDSWLMRELRAGHILRLPCGEIAVDDLYFEVELPPPGPHVLSA